MINRATVTKFGIELGEATIVFRRQPSAAEARGDGTATTKRASRRSKPSKPHAIVRDGNLSFRLRLPSIQSQMREAAFKGAAWNRGRPDRSSSPHGNPRETTGRAAHGGHLRCRQRLQDRLRRQFLLGDLQPHQRQVPDRLRRRPRLGRSRGEFLEPDRCRQCPDQRHSEEPGLSGAATGITGRVPAHELEDATPITFERDFITPAALYEVCWISTMSAPRPRSSHRR